MRSREKPSRKKKQDFKIKAITCDFKIEDKYETCKLNKDPQTYFKAANETTTPQHSPHCSASEPHLI